MKKAKNGISNTIPSYRISVNNAKTPNEADTTLMSLLKNRYKAREPSSTYAGFSYS